MKITVTKEDIEASKKTFYFGTRYTGQRHGPCPIERAFKRNGIDVTVGLTIIHIFGDFEKDKYDRKDYFKQIMSPKEIGNFPYEFDRSEEFRETCQPFSFEFEMPK